MNDDSRGLSVSRAVTALRLTLGVFLLQWGAEKFLEPGINVAIWGHFYGLAVSHMVGYVFGTVEIAIALCMFLGIFRTPAYGAALALHAVSVAVSWRQLVDPWGEPSNHLFVAGIPVLGALLALFLLRDWDQTQVSGSPDAG